MSTIILNNPKVSLPSYLNMCVVVLTQKAYKEYTRYNSPEITPNFIVVMYCAAAEREYQWLGNGKQERFKNEDIYGWSLISDITLVQQVNNGIKLHVK